MTLSEQIRRLDHSKHVWTVQWTTIGRLDWRRYDGLIAV